MCLNCMGPLTSDRRAKHRVPPNKAARIGNAPGSNITDSIQFDRVERSVHEFPRAPVDLAAAFHSERRALIGVV